MYSEQFSGQCRPLLTETGHFYTSHDAPRYHSHVRVLTNGVVCLSVPLLLLAGVNLKVQFKQ